MQNTSQQAKETILAQILEADLQILFNILEPLSEEMPEVYKAVKYGIKIKYHIEYNLKNIAEIRERQQTVLLQGKTIPLEEWWNEEEERRKTARQALIEYYSKEETPYRSR